MNLCTFVTARNHPSEIEMFSRHLPFWLAPYTLYDGPRVIISPVGSEYRHDGFEPMSCGTDIYAGAKALARLIGQFQMILERFPEADWFFFNEPDSFSIKPKIPDCILENPGIYGPFVNNGDPRFTTPYYVNMPMLISNVGMVTLCESFSKLPLNSDPFDRWVTRLMIEQGIPHHDYGNYGFTMGPIPDEATLQLASAISEGAQFIHGVKTQKVLDVCKGGDVE